MVQLFVIEVNESDRGYKEMRAGRNDECNSGSIFR